MEITISKFIKIENNTIWLNGEKVFSAGPDIDFRTFLKVLYRRYAVKYLKFFKMDNLSKLGFLASEILLEGQGLIKRYPNDKIGVILSNSNSTLDIDQQYYDLIKDSDNYFPSPALFVYTLPNIMIGEICIKNKFRGESATFIMKEYDPNITVDYIKNLFLQNKIKVCIAGFVDYTKDNYDAFLYLAENTELLNGIAHNAENINNLYYQRE